METLEEKLRSYSSSGMIPMHMPGHKRNAALTPSYYSHDITEIEGFDNLHKPEGILKSLEAEAAGIWNARSSIISVNGASAPILAAVCAAAARGRILVASNCHISVWHALELSNADFVFLNPLYSPEAPFFLEICPDKVRDILSKDKSIRSVIITSPGYEGIVSDTRAVYDICREYNAALIVDESHGAHFGLNPFFPQTAAADVVIKSIHKTLHAPTQTALLLTYSDAVSRNMLRHYMDIFISTSPSYLLLEGISRVIFDLKSDKNITEPWVRALNMCRGKLSSELKHLKLFRRDGADPSKLIIITGGVIDGEKLGALLRASKIEIEAAFGDYIIAMTGIGDTEDSLSGFADALIRIDEGLKGNVNELFEPRRPEEEAIYAMPISKAAAARKITLEKRNCEGRVSASYVFKYPPGIPLLIPGQVITNEIVNILDNESLEVTVG